MPRLMMLEVLLYSSVETNSVKTDNFCNPLQALATIAAVYMYQLLAWNHFVVFTKNNRERIKLGKSPSLIRLAEPFMLWSEVLREHYLHK